MAIIDVREDPRSAQLEIIHKALGPRMFEGFMDSMAQMPWILLMQLDKCETHGEKQAYLRGYLIDLVSLCLDEAEMWRNEDEEPYM